MKNSKKNLGFAGQSKAEGRVSHKHDANLQKNSALYFQIGLILCLLLTYALFEMQFQKKELIVESLDYSQETIIDVADVFTLEPVRSKELNPEIKRSPKLKDRFTPVEDITKQLESKIVSDEDKNLPKALDPKTIIDIVETTDEVDDIFIEAVQVVPIFPGCEKYNTNEERKKCMSKKIGRLVSKKFNTDIGVENGIDGVHKIYTQFTIDKNGEVTSIKVRGPHPALEKEAERVITKIPKMQPGRQENKPVGVVYTLPIKFSIKH